MSVLQQVASSRFVGRTQNSLSQISRAFSFVTLLSPPPSCFWLKVSYPIDTCDIIGNPKGT